MKPTTTCALIDGAQVLLTHEGFRYWPAGSLPPGPCSVSTSLKPGQMILAAASSLQLGSCGGVPLRAPTIPKRKGCRKGKKNSLSRQIRKQLKSGRRVCGYLLVTKVGGLTPLLILPGARTAASLGVVSHLTCFLLATEVSGARRAD